MPIYEVTSPTGQTLSIQGNTPPSEQQLNQIFAKGGFNIGPNAAHSNQNPNELGKFYLPRMSSVKQKQSTGQKVSLDEGLGAAGEFANRVVMPVIGKANPLLWGAGGAIEGLTTPGASPEERIKAAGIGGATEYAGAKFLPPIASKVGKVIKNTASSIKNVNISTNKVAQLTNDAAAKAHLDLTNRVSHDDLINKVTEAVKKKFRWTSDVRDATNNFVSSMTKVPDTVIADQVGQAKNLPMIGGTEWGPTDLLQFRRQITNTSGSGIFDAMRKSSADLKVESVARGVISNELKKMAPEVAKLDKLYMYAKETAPAIRERVGKAAVTAATGGIAGGTIYELGKLFGGGGQ